MVRKLLYITRKTISQDVNIFGTPFLYESNTNLVMYLYKLMYNVNLTVQVNYKYVKTCHNVELLQNEGSSNNKHTDCKVEALQRCL